MSTIKSKEDAAYVVNNDDLIPLVNNAGDAAKSVTPEQLVKPVLGAVVAAVATVDDLRSIIGTAGETIKVLHHTTPGDGGGGYFTWDAASTLADDDGLVIKEATTGTGRWFRDITEGCWVKYWGGVDGATIQAAIDSTKGRNLLLSPTSYTLTAMSIELQQEQSLLGAGKSFRGTLLVPTTDVPAIKSGIGANGLKQKVGGFLIEADTLTSAYAIDIVDSYLCEFEDIWVKDSVNGIRIVASNSLHFTNVMVMEDSDGTALMIGDGSTGSTNHVFTGCNFETNTIDTGGDVVINGGNGLASASFFGCQVERSDINVIAGSILFSGGRLSAGSNLILRERASSCNVDTLYLAGVDVMDLGHDTVLRNVHCDNMDTTEHKWPTPTPLVSQTAEYGATGEEWLFLVTAVEKSHNAASTCTIAIADQTGTLETGNTFDLDATGNSVGQTFKPTYTQCFGVKSTNGAMGPVITNTDLMCVRGGKNLLTNGTELDTTWATNDVVVTGVFDAWVLTPANTTWMLYQDINAGICEIGKRYIVVAKFDGDATLVFGSAWNGGAGVRPLYTNGIPNFYGDGDTVAMMSFEYTGQQARVGIGSLSISTAVTARWIMLIEA